MRARFICGFWFGLKFSSEAREMDKVGTGEKEREIAKTKTKGIPRN